MYYAEITAVSVGTVEVERAEGVLSPLVGATGRIVGDELKVLSLKARRDGKRIYRDEFSYEEWSELLRALERAFEKT